MAIPWECIGIKDADIDIAKRPSLLPPCRTKHIRQTHPPLLLEEVPKHRYQTLVGKPRSLHREQNPLHRLPYITAFSDRPGRKTHTLGDSMENLLAIVAPDDDMKQRPSGIQVSVS
jgi:hypothetical protein